MIPKSVRSPASTRNNTTTINNTSNLSNCLLSISKGGRPLQRAMERVFTDGYRDGVDVGNG